MTAARPDALAVLCDDIRRKSRKVQRDYEWLYASGYEARRRGSSGRTYVGSVRDASTILVGPLSDDEQRTEAERDAHEGGTAAIRRLLARAAKEVTAAKVKMVAASDTLSRLADLIDTQEEKSLPDLAVLKTLGSWSDNRADGEAAAAKRAGRGAALPDSDYGLPATG